MVDTEIHDPSKSGLQQNNLNTCYPKSPIPHCMNSMKSNNFNINKNQISKYINNSIANQAHEGQQFNERNLDYLNV